MKKNAIASLLLAFATAFALADNLGTASLVGDLSSTSDYVYTADQADAVVTAAKTAAVAYTTAVSNKLDKAATTSAAGLMSAADKTKLDGLYKGITTVSDGFDYFDFTTGEASWLNIKGSGAVSSSMSDNTVTISVADASTSAKGVVQLSTSTNGNSTAKAATESAVKDAISAAKSYTDSAVAAGSYTHPSYTARTGKPTANASPTWGGTFTVSQIKSDSTGHVTDAVDRTITIPSAAATTSAAGLMSAADKTALDSLSSGAVLKTTVSAALTAQGIASNDDIDTLNETIAELKKVIAVLEALD